MKGRLRRPRRGEPTPMTLQQETGPLSILPQDLRKHLQTEREEDDHFEDAAEEHLELNMDLYRSLADCELAIKKFFNNDLESAMNIMQVWSRTSLYHSLGVSIFEFIPAVLTLDSTQVARALAALKRTHALCQQHRRCYTLVETLGTIIKKVYTEGVWFLLFEGRLQVLRGQCAESAANYLRAVETPRLWGQLGHLSYWELMWVNAFKVKTKEDAFLAPYALVEAAMCHYAERILNDTRRRYSNYALESSLLFRTHSKLQIIRDGKNSNPGGSRRQSTVSPLPTREPGMALSMD